MEVKRVSGDYYTQYATIRGVEVKASDDVDPEALQEAAKIVAMMLDGRRDIADCISKWPGAALAIYPKGDVVTDLPEFAFLKGKSDIWDVSYDSGGVLGLGGIKTLPVSSTSEQSLIQDPEYPHHDFYVAVHEFAHLLMNLCFTSADQRTIRNLLHSPGIVELGLGKGIIVSKEEFFANLSEIYFSVHRVIPKRHLEQFPTDVLEFIEAFYGPLASMPADDPAYIRYASSSGVATTWKTAVGRVYEHPRFGYAIDLLPGWELTQQQTNETVISLGHHQEIRILYFDISQSETLSDLVDWRLDQWNRWTGSWDESEVKSSELETVDGYESHWIRYQAHESPGYCEIEVIERLLIITHDGARYGVLLRWSGCSGDKFLGTKDLHVKDGQAMLRSFVP